MGQDGFARGAEDSLLFGVLVKHLVKVQLMDFLFEVEGHPLLDQLQTALGQLIPEGSDSNVHFDLGILLVVMGVSVTLNAHFAIRI